MNWFNLEALFANGSTMDWLIMFVRGLLSNISRVRALSAAAGPAC